MDDRSALSYTLLFSMKSQPVDHQSCSRLVGIRFKVGLEVEAEQSCCSGSQYGQ